MKKARNHIGTISLLAAVAGFLFVTLQPWIPLGRLILLPGLSLKTLLAAFFDASLVGALADWFAVSALFKNPLGIKLPHTDILAKSKNALAEAVPRFLTSFAGEDRISSELARIDFAAKLEELLGRPGSRREIHDFIGNRMSVLLAPYSSVTAGRSENLETLVREIFSFVIERLDPASLCADLLRWARREGVDEKILESAAGFLSVRIGRNRGRLAGIITPIIKRNTGWQGLLVGQRTVERLIQGAEEELSRVGSHADNDARRMLLGALDSYAGRLAGETMDRDGDREKFLSMVNGVLRDKSFQSRVAGIVAALLRNLGQDLSRDDSSVLEALSRAEDALQTSLAKDDGLRSRINREVAALVSDFIRKSRLVEVVAGYFTALLKSTDEREFVGRVEAAVWNDLQYIRVNGAVVGGLVGLALAVVSALLPK